MRIALIAKDGQLGRSILEISEIDKEFDFYAFNKKELNLTLEEETTQKLTEINPDIIINASAYTAVDLAEKEPEKAFDLNSKAPLFLAMLCKKINAILIHISTDYVFDGIKTKAYKEDDKINPIGIYGKSKELGEKNIRGVLKKHIIIRTSWLYSKFGKNFPKTMIELAEKNDTISVVNDQFGSPTYAPDLAIAIFIIIRQIANKNNFWGTYHFSNKGIISWYDFAKKIFEVKNNKSIKIFPISSVQHKTLCQRPTYSVLNCEKIAKNFDIKQKNWEDSLKDYMLKCFKFDFLTKQS